MECGATGKVTNTYSFAEGRVSAIIDGDTYYYLNDGRGSVSELTMTSGSPAVVYKYDIYGKTFASNDDVNNPYQYNAEYTDSTTGLQYLRARYYNSDTHRFQTKDTYQGNVEQPITRNNYAYANNNPVNFVDPSGHFFEQIWGFGSGVKNWAKEGMSGLASGQGFGGFKTANYHSGYDEGAAQGKALDEKLGISSTNNSKASSDRTSSTSSSSSSNSRRTDNIIKKKDKVSTQAVVETYRPGCDASLSSVQADGIGTVTFGVSLSGAFGGYVSSSVGVAIDRDFNVKILTTGSAGGGTPGAGLTGFITLSDAPSVDALEGEGAGIGASGGEGLIYGVDYDVSYDSETYEQYNAFTFSVGTGFRFPVPAEIHGRVSKTKELEW